MFWLLRRFILRAENSFDVGLKFIPICYGCTIALVALFILYKGSAGINLDFFPTWSILLFVVLLGILVGVFVYILKPVVAHLAYRKAGLEHDLELPFSVPFFNVQKTNQVNLDELGDNEVEIELSEKSNNNQESKIEEKNLEIKEAEIELDKTEINLEKENKDEQEEIQEENEEKKEKEENEENEFKEIELEDENQIVNKESIDEIEIVEEDKVEEKIEEQNSNKTKEIIKEAETEEIVDVEITAEAFNPCTEQLFSIGQVLMAIVGSFAHGANDIANAIGPFAVVYSIYKTGAISSSGGVIPWWILAMGGLGIVTGLAMWGYRVIETIGEKLTKVTPSRGFNIELGSAITVMGASRIGIPLSTTHCKVGAVIGVGLCDGGAAVQWKMVGNVAVGWFVTLPIAGVVSAVVFLFMIGLGNYS